MTKEYERPYWGFEPLLVDVTPVLPGEWTFWADQSNAQSNTTPGGSVTLNHAPIGPIKLASFTCSWELNNWGNGEAVIPLEGCPMTRADLVRFYGWRLWAFFNNQPVWMGLPTALDDEGGPAVTVTFVEGIGYIDRKQHALNRTYTQQEQTYIAAELAARLDNVGIRRVTQPGPGFLRDRTYQYLEGSSRGDLLTNLTQVIQGPEFRSEYAIDATGRLDPSIRIAYPRVGRDSGLGIKVPGGAVSYHLKWDSEQFRTRTFAVGELPETAAATDRRPVVLVTQTQWDRGIPNIDSVDDWPGVILRSTLTERANANAQTYNYPTLEVSATMPVSLPPLGSYGVGDDVLLQIADPLTPEGYSTTGRLTGMAADAAAGTVDWTVQLAQPPSRLDNTLTGTLARAASFQANNFHQRLEAPPPGIEE